MIASERVPHAQYGHALWLWRVGEQRVRQRRVPDWRRDYDAAVAAVVAVLQRYHSVDELTTAYFDDIVDDWLEPLCRRPSGRVLNFGIVEDAAYWRRLKQLTRTHG